MGVKLVFSLKIYFKKVRDHSVYSVCVDFESGIGKVRRIVNRKCQLTKLKQSFNHATNLVFLNLDHFNDSV